MARLRSAKRLGTRHDLNYFKRWSTGRKVRTALLFIVPVLFLFWSFAPGTGSIAQSASSGPLSRAHSFFGNDCAKCHSQTIAGFRITAFKAHASDEACLSCHAAPVHHSNQTETPSCASCHTEHKGSIHLTQVAERSCTACHADLKTASGNASFARAIHSFNGDHPEFSAVKANKDPGTIAFNHAVHMASLIGPDNKRVRLECEDCHRPAADAGRPWRYASAEWQPPANSGDRTTILPPTYAASCAACHDLRFDPQSRQSAPHDKPQIVRAFLQKTYAGSVAYAPPSAPVRFSPLNTAFRNAGGPAQRLQAAERLLWGKTCKQCHESSFGQEVAGSLPIVAKADITTAWLPHAKFNHDAHRTFDCVSCHQAATSSQNNSDVLIPSIATCKTCHNGDPRKSGHAENSCYECHSYHDWKQQTGFRGRFNIQQPRGTD